ncbi:TIGR01212 family radical SAM protein [Anoxynatronum buryatiense]|nr:TIGR01212 family radical SAM protein [Anoxynatronum buryatiense]
MKNELRYRSYAAHLRERYGKKVYKIPLNLPAGCPNRDGSLGSGGCDFCAPEGAGFELLPERLSVDEQLKTNMDYIGSRYGVDTFIAYFQNYSNTYLSIVSFEQAIRAAVHPNVVEMAISTRPDCVDERHLTLLKEIQQETGIRITFELGLQTANYRTLYQINRGHGLASFIDAVLRVHRYEFEVCAHVILNLPGDDNLDAVETARILSALKVEQVKVHALYLMKNTKMGEAYEQGAFQMISLEDYQERAILFLEHVAPEMVVQRLIGRAPEKNSIFVNWGTSWWKIRDEIHQKMERENRRQGTKYQRFEGFSENVTKSEKI